MEIARVSKLFLAAKKGQIAKSAGKEMSEISLNTDVSSDDGNTSDDVDANSDSDATIQK